MLPGKQLTVDKDRQTADKWILHYSTETKSAVCTNDTELRKRLRSAGVTAMTLGADGRLR